MGFLEALAARIEADLERNKQHEEKVDEACDRYGITEQFESEMKELQELFPDQVRFLKHVLHNHLGQQLEQVFLLVQETALPLTPSVRANWFKLMAAQFRSSADQFETAEKEVRTKSEKVEKTS